MAVELGELKVDSSKLEIGMYVTRLDRPWEETDFLLQGFLITSPEDIDALVNQCNYVYIESKKHAASTRPLRKPTDHERRSKKQGLGARIISRITQKPSDHQRQLKTNQTTPNTKEKINYINKVPVEQEFAAAKGCYKYAKLTAKNIMEGIRIGRMLDMNQCKDVVDDIVESILRNSNALTWLTKIKNKDDYTAEHSLNVCILSVAFARHLGLSEEEIHTIGLCGLLHDVGKAKVPNEVLNKPGRFTDDEMELMKQHTTFGRDLLITMQDCDLATVDVAYCHHERIDEKGYPRNLQAHQIPYYAKLIAVTDTYDAITSSRVYDNARSSMTALDIIYTNKGKQFDESLALEFIKFIGVYPPGAIVKMTNEEVGIVISSNPDNKLRPKIMRVLDANKQPVKHSIIDLKQVPKDEQGEPYMIAHELPNGSHGVDIKSFLKKGLKLKK